MNVDIPRPSAPALVLVLGVTLGLAAACRVAAVRLMHGMDSGLMAMLVALGVMSVLWMSLVAALVSAQKLLPAKTVIDVPLALAIVGLGVVTVVAPSLLPGLTPAPM